MELRNNWKGKQKSSRRSERKKKKVKKNNLGPKNFGKLRKGVKIP